MAKASGPSNSNTVVTSAPQDAEAKSLFHALSEIEQLSLAEMHSSLPEEVLPLKPRWSYIDVACKSAALMTLVTFVTAPFSIAVIQKIMPAFGNTDPTIIDKIYVYAFSSAPVVGCSILITSIISKTYTGNVMKSVVNRFASSYIITKMFISLFLLLMTYLLATRWLTPEVINGFLSHIEIFFKKDPAAKASVFRFLMEFKQILVPAAIYATIVHLATSAMVAIGYISGSIRTREIEEMRRYWD